MQQWPQERGVAMVIALLAIGVITAVGFALMLSSATETLIHRDFRGSGVAFYASRGGLEEARGRMGPAAGVNRIPPPPDVNTGIYILLNNTIDPRAGCAYNGGNCADPDPPRNFSFQQSLQDPLSPANPAQVPYAWVKITLATQEVLGRNLVNPAQPPPLATVDPTQVYFDGRNLFLCAVPPCEGSPVFIYTAMAIEPGGSRHIVREVGSYANTPGLPAALTLDGPNPSFRGGTSARYGISGIDQGAQSDDEAAIGVIDNSDIGTVESGAPRPGNYPGSGSASPPPADVQNVSGSLDPLYQDCDGLDLLVANLRLAADHVYTGTTAGLPDPGSTGSPVTNVVDGDLTLSGTFSGAGILVVTGNLYISGDPSFDGIIYVVGSGSMTISGSGNGVFRGGIFIANTEPSCSTSGTLGSPQFAINGGGNSGIRYNTDFTEPPGGNLPIRILELNY